MADSGGPAVDASGSIPTSTRRWNTATTLIVLVTNLLLMLVYSVSLLRHIDNVHYATVPWTWRRSSWKSGWWEDIPHDVADVPGRVLGESGCLGESVVLADNAVWSPAEKSGLCRCLHARFSPAAYKPYASKEDLRTAVLQCAVASKPMTEEGLFSYWEAWSTNPILLVGAWNVISLVFVMCKAGTKEISMSLRICLHLVSSVVVLIASGLLQQWFIFSVMIVFTIIALFVLLQAQQSGEKEKKSFDFNYFWVHLVFILPITFVLFNISNQKRDVLLNLCSIVFALSVVFSGWGANLVSSAQSEWQSASAADSDNVDAGKQVEQIRVFAVFGAVVTVGTFYLIAYPSFGGIFATNIAGISGLSLALVFLSVLWETSSDASNVEKTSSVRMFLDTAARSLVTIAAIVDIHALSA